MKITVEQRIQSVYEKMLGRVNKDCPPDLNDIVRICAEVTMEETDIVWDLAVEETACNASPDDELDGFVVIHKPAIYKTKSDWGFEYFEYIENL